MTGQLGFDAPLADAERDNRAQALARATAHLPGTMDEALVFYRSLIERYVARELRGRLVAIAPRWRDTFV